MTQHGRFTWNELNTRDARAAQAFYAATLGWSFEEMPMGTGPSYWIARLDGAAVAGIFTMTGPAFDGIPDHWFAYVEVDDVDRRAALVPDAGGTVMRQPWTIPGVGRIAIVRDAVGAVSGWMTSAPAA